MERRNFLAAVSAMALVSCSRDDKRGAPYDPHECPFCVTKKGVCTYCNGTKRCAFCKGTGIRRVVVPNLPERNIAASWYEEQCPFCEGKGVCRYCKGKGTCWACDGTGRIDSWDFFEKANK